MTAPPRRGPPSAAPRGPEDRAEPAPAGEAGAPQSADLERRNFRLGVLNGAIYQTGEGFIDAGTVIPLFVSRLTTSNAVVGMATAMNDLGWLLPQVLVAPWAARFPRQIVVYRLAAAVRGAALAALAVAAATLSDRPEALLAAFFACYAVFSLGAGVGGVAFMEVVGRVVPRPRLGAFWSLRLFFGGIGLAAVGLLVRRVLQIEDFGVRYTTMFALGALLVSSAYVLFSAIQEPPQPAARPPGSPAALLGRGLRMLRGDASFRNLLLSRATLSVWLSMSPFMVLFAVRELGGGARAAGTFLFARVAGFVLANLLWQRLSSRHGTRVVMRVATAAAAGLAFAAAGTALASPWALGWIGAGAAVIVLEVLAAVGGAAQSGMLVGYASLVLELAPRDGRQVFVSLANTFIGPTMLLPMLGGALIDATNPAVLFTLCGIAGIAGFRAASRLPRTAAPPGAPELVAGEEP